MRPQSGKPVIEHNGLWDEMEAAHRFGWEAYWNASRPERGMMTGDVRARNVIRAMVEYEASKDKK